MQIKDITNYLEGLVPLEYQESYDNCGLLVGNPNSEVKGISLTLDVTEEVIAEAIQNGDNLIIAHHPLIFKGLKSLTGNHWVERCIIKAIQNGIAIYAIHTNLDNYHLGVNRRIAERLGLKQVRTLSPKSGLLTKLTTFVPKDNTQEVLDALYAAGAGSIGDYDHCSFRVAGTGTFRPGAHTNPHIGAQHVDETVTEDRVEVIFPNHLSGKILASLRQAHPYEEVAYYLTSLSNKHQDVGSGMIGVLENPMDTAAFLAWLKEKMQTKCIRHTAITRNKVSKVALCGGAGSFLLSSAIRQGADVFITGDFKYHEFFEADGQTIIADIGHYESEQFTKDLLYDILSEKFTNIALRLSDVQTNPINYL
ncbi:Nif3-like dinuclear metal center hexameric protein [Marinoscillum furvescens]|uniref:GTP cyclohydrolase 1 type 2 homolog n=1 Tax=Marinoscillum furvescens DSM 4134 TaxID=1122208 RepID=A0A3D9KYT5_MARFU|nr:Nif3-like dinuclear metal center hexameric protein [Marinoscillum furvescens]RED93859.1 dinuclear metal center YbgI/SA1388 family protein [Marinoscillum furvescens DSM 4134]